MFPLLGYASSMIRGDLVMDVVDRLNLWGTLDIIWLPFYCVRATILGHISPISGVPSCLSGCWLMPTCDC